MIIKRHGNDKQFLPFYSLANIKILIIDDDVELAESIKLFFEDYDSIVTVANNGENGIAAFEKDIPDIVLVDLNMPGMGGHLVVSTLSKIAPETPVVVVSGTGIIKEAIRSMNLGAWDFVSKPILNFEEIEMSVLRALEKAHLRRENENYKLNLEKLVEERTSELEGKKNELEKMIADLEIAKNKAENADQMKTEFLAQMSHEIRTPLNGILGQFGFLLDEENDRYPELHSTYNSIKHASRRLIRTVELILEMSELTSNSYPYEEESLDLKEVLEEIVMNYESKIIEKGVECKINLQDSSFSVNMDRNSITQIFHNLIDNAYKYTSSGNVTVSLFRTGKTINVEIEDTGIGMSEKYLTQLYKPFSQEEVGYTRSYEGNGLGLALTKKYCDLNKIDIKIFSRKNVGTKVILSIYNN